MISATQQQAAKASALFLSLFSPPFIAITAAFTRKDVIYNLENTSDPEAEAAIKAFQREAYKAAAKGAAALAAPAEPELSLTAKVERKYAAAAIVESGIQVGGGRKGWMRAARRGVAWHVTCGERELAPCSVVFAAHAL